MKGSDFDELAFFRNVQASNSRCLLIGRRALVILGLPVLTADYDFWLHLDDIDAFNAAAVPFGLVPSRIPSEAKRHGRYVLENDEHIDVLVARSVPTVDGTPVLFDDLWVRKNPVEVAPGVVVHLPSIDDLIATKRFARRARDLEDIRLLEKLKRQRP